MSTQFIILKAHAFNISKSFIIYRWMFQKNYECDIQLIMPIKMFWYITVSNLYLHVWLSIRLRNVIMRFVRKLIIYIHDIFSIVHLAAAVAASSLYSEQRQMKINRPSLTHFLTTHFFHYFGSMYHHRQAGSSRYAREVKHGEYLSYKTRTEDRELPQLSHLLFHHLRTYSRHCLFLQNSMRRAREFGGSETTTVRQVDSG